MAACLLPALSGCGAGDAAKVDLPPPTPPASLLVPCADPVALPARDLTGAEIEVLWGRDRSALRVCGGQIMGLAEWL